MSLFCLFIRLSCLIVQIFRYLFFSRQIFLAGNTGTSGEVEASDNEVESEVRMKYSECERTNAYVVVAMTFPPIARSGNELLQCRPYGGPSSDGFVDVERSSVTRGSTGEREPSI